MTNRLLLIAILLLAVQAAAQRMSTIPNFRQLPGPVVHKMLHDEEGYLWYGTTESGLCRDNGYQIDMFSGGERTGRFVNTMTLTRDHRILFGTRTGAWLLDKRQGYRVERFDTIVTKGHDVQSVVAAADGTFWLTSGSMVWHFNAQRQLMHMFNISHHGERQQGLTVYEDSAGRLWLLLHNGNLRRYNSQRNDFDDCLWDIPYAPLTMEEDTLRHCYWIGTEHGGIVRYDVTGPTARITLNPATQGQAPYSPQGFVFGICIDADRLWVSALDNLYCYRIDPADRLLHPVNTSAYIPASRKVLDCPVLDSRGNIWVPSYTPNPFVITPVDMDICRYDIPTMESTTGYPLIADLVERDAEGFWILQSHVGVMYYRTADGQLVYADADSPAQNVWGEYLLVASRQAPGVWTRQNEALLHISLDGRRLRRRVAATFESSPQTISETGSGTLLVGTTDALYSVDAATGRKMQLLTGTGHIADVCQTDKGDIYFISERQGFARIDTQGRVVTIDRKHRFNRFAIDGSHSIWLSTADGLVARYDIDGSQLATDEIASDRRGCVIKQMQTDADGHLWILTSLYVKEYNPRNGSFRIFNTTDTNIRIDYFQDVKAHGHDVCFSGAGAIFSLHSSEQLEETIPEAHPLVSDIAIDDEKLHISYGQTSVDVPAHCSQLLVYLTTLNHLHTDKIAFAYRFQGEEKWNYLPAGLNIVQIANLSKGTYQLEVKATNEQGRWCEPAEALTIERLPAWWETWWARLVWLTVGLLILGLLIRLYLLRQQRKNQADMEHQLTEMKFRFFTNIGHELRTPLTLIITPLTTLIGSEPEGDRKRKLQAILNHANELLKQINNLLSFRKLERGEMQLNLRYGELNDYARQAVESFLPLYEKKGVALEYRPSPVPLNFYFDKNILHIILFNLLGNAQKFTPQGGKVTLAIAKTDDGKVTVSVADTGIGMTAEQQKHIFERFYQAESGADFGQNGSGIGLNMVKEVVAIHQGSIRVESAPGQGSTFTVILPWQLKKEEVAMADEELARPAPGDKDLTVLLVEDNDEFRQFVAEELAKSYHVLQAANGKEGLDIAEREQVDVVVSDVMMPVMDGMELCRQLKTNEKTSHQTVILLTAKSAQESELQGYKLGADYYITKPFDMAMLTGRLQQIERMQKQRRKELLRQLENPDVETLYNSDIDKEFMKKVFGLLTRHLDDSDYGRDELASDLCMSYVTAYRKIKALTGQSPNEFIRNFRLKQAAQQLRSSNIPITEVAMNCGFVTASYFATAFTKEHGMSPSDYRKKMRKGGAADNKDE